jgi:hypothetical protein
MTRTVAPAELATEIEAGSSAVALAASEDGLMTEIELAAVNGGTVDVLAGAAPVSQGQATGKRQHEPMRFRMYYDQ